MGPALSRSVPDEADTSGDDATFYSYLGIERDASPAQLTKAYRKRSLELHPDKNHGVPGIQQKFARLGVITGILRDGPRRDRYNVSPSTHSFYFVTQTDPCSSS